MKKIFEMQDLEIPHQPYSHEQRKLASITEGNLQKLRKCQQEKFEGQLGKVADEPLRHEKNMSIIVLTLASRAAIQGGLSPELAFSMTDNFICTIEKMDNIEQIIKVLPEYESEFALCVSELKHNHRQNPYVETAKDYIYKHLHNIDIHKLWEHIGIDGDYLCRLFKKYEGITVKEYILMQKIDHAKDDTESIPKILLRKRQRNLDYDKKSFEIKKYRRLYIIIFKKLIYYKNFSQGGILK